MSGGKRARPIRVALVGPSLDILGGQAVQLQRLRERLSTVPELEVSFIPVNPRLPGVLRALQRVKYLRTIVTEVAYVWSLLRQVPRVDVVHAFSASYWSFLLAPVPALVVARIFGKASVLNYRSGEADDHLQNWKTAVPLMKLASAIVVPSGYLVAVFAKYGLKARAVFNFVELEKLPFRERGALRPLFFSNRNLEALYNVACTIRAFALVQREIPHAALTVAGDGAQRASLERLVAELGLHNVTFLGRVPPNEMAACYDAADVYLNTPNIDNMPNSVIEAFACGIPVVTSNAGGIPYIVRHDTNGLMVASDDADALAREALRLLRDEGLADRLVATAREECLTRYVWAAVRSEWIALYTELAARGPGLGASDVASA